MVVAVGCKRGIRFGLMATWKDGFMRRGIKSCNGITAPRI